MPLSTDMAVRPRETEIELQPILVDLLRLQLFAKHLHWNVVGSSFRSLHAMFDAFADSYRDWADRLAERKRALGDCPDGRPRAVLAVPDAHDVPCGEIAGDVAVRCLLSLVEAVVGRVRASRAACGDDDFVTQDLLTTILEGLDLQSWMLRAHL